VTISRSEVVRPEGLRTFDPGLTLEGPSSKNKAVESVIEDGYRHFIATAEKPRDSRAKSVVSPLLQPNTR